jgi:hypothetical protein
MGQLLFRSTALNANDLLPVANRVFGMTGVAKSVIIAALLAQIGHRFGFHLIVEEGLSHAVLTQTQGCEPVIINPNGNICYRKSVRDLGLPSSREIVCVLLQADGKKAPAAIYF